MSHGGTRTPWTRRTHSQREVEQLLECTVAQAREEMQLRHCVVGEYAALGKAQVAAVADTFADENPVLDACVAGLLGELDVSNAQLAVARTLTAELEDMHAKFAAKQTRVDVRSAAGMVQRYMTTTTTLWYPSLAALCAARLYNGHARDQCRGAAVVAAEGGRSGCGRRAHERDGGMKR
ncbi:hypothetical protein DFH07DRAFT_769032 [Mycena maculata]|uniref:Uncharacterized protein n=1 Tax=Mycena maculata TaxID=230809 RepID=A0AAD7JPB6_9AGAR|nr:hypothetical protein DFH07DRAFT_769032 [Mycena maculata]